MQPTKNLTMKNMVISLAKQSLSDDIYATREKFLKKSVNADTLFFMNSRFWRMGIK